MPEVGVLDSTMHYEEAGDGAAIVLVHGNPTSSYLWRHITPVLASEGRCLAVDLIGFGRSGKPDIDYGFFDQARYLSAWLATLGLDDITFVGHDWGGALAFHWAAQNPGRVRGMAFMQTYVRPQAWQEWEPPEAREIFKLFRRAQGDELILDQNLFIELVLPAGMHRDLSETEMTAYRAPFQEREARRSILAFPRDLPMEGEPADVVAQVEAYGKWLGSSNEIPKLLLTLDPGTVLTESVVAWCRDNIASLEIERSAPACTTFRKIIPRRSRPTSPRGYVAARRADPEVEMESLSASVFHVP